jgi:hypothetical protein
MLRSNCSVATAVTSVRIITVIGWSSIRSIITRYNRPLKTAAAAMPANKPTTMPSPKTRVAKYAPNAPTVMLAPWAKLSTPPTPKMSVNPIATKT